MLYRHIQQGIFTPPVRIGLRASGWPEHELEALNAAQLAGKSRDELKALVARLVAQRQPEVAVT